MDWKTIKAFACVQRMVIKKIDFVTFRVTRYFRGRWGGGVAAFRGSLLSELYGNPIQRGGEGKG